MDVVDFDFDGSWFGDALDGIITALDRRQAFGGHLRIHKTTRFVHRTVLRVHK